MIKDPPKTNSDMNIYLFSLDVECDRNTSDGDEFTGRVPGNIDCYLDFLAEHKMCCTFFVLGNIARKYPDMLRKIEDQGHEIACHSNLHIPLTRMNEASFKEDLQKNIASIKDAGIQTVSGFRAPFFSLTDQTPWAYKVMQDEGIRYSSSVIPVKNPTYCWEGFNPQPSMFMNDVWELPISSSGLPVLNVPFGGGVYFRVLPFFLVQSLFKKYAKRSQVVTGYFHPYDIDMGQDKDAFPEFADKAFFRHLMFRNRDTVFDKLAKLIRGNFHVMTYSRYIEEELEGN